MPVTAWYILSMKAAKPFFKLFPFWIFIIFFKSAAALHYTLFPILSEQLFPVWVAGLLVSLEAFFQMLFDVPAGYLLDRFGYVRTLMVSTSSFLLGAGVLAFGIKPWTVILSLVFAFVGWIFFGPGIDAYILVKSERKLAGRYMALRDTTASAGVVIGMVALPFVVHLEARFVALIMAVPFVLSLFALMRASKDTASIMEKRKKGHHSYLIRRHFIHHVLASVRKLNPVSSVLMLQRFSAAFFYGTLWFVLPLMMLEMTQKGPMSFALAVFDLSTLLMGFLLGRLADRWNKRHLIFLGMMLFSIFALFLGFHFGFLFILFGFLATTGDEMASISLWAWLDELDTKHTEDGLISGMLTLAEDLGWTAGPLLAGLLYIPLGPTWTIVIGGGMITLAWIASSFMLFRPPYTRAAVFHTPILPLPSHRPHKR